MIWKEAVIHWLHLLAAISWLGGMIFAAMLLNPVLRANFSPADRAPLFKAVGRRFRRVEWACLIVLFSTGTYKLLSPGPLSAVFSGDYGKILTVKLSLVAGMLVLSFLHTRLAGGIVFWARVNLLLGLVVVFCGAMLRMNGF